MRWGRLRAVRPPSRDDGRRSLLAVLHGILAPRILVSRGLQSTATVLFLPVFLAPRRLPISEGDCDELSANSRVWFVLRYMRARSWHDGAPPWCRQEDTFILFFAFFVRSRSKSIIEHRLNSRRNYLLLDYTTSCCDGNHLCLGTQNTLVEQNTFLSNPQWPSAIFSNLEKFDLFLVRNRSKLIIEYRLNFLRRVPILPDRATSFRDGYYSWLGMEIDLSTGFLNPRRSSIVFSELPKLYFFSIQSRAKSIIACGWYIWKRIPILLDNTASFRDANHLCSEIKINVSTVFLNHGWPSTTFF